VGVFNTAETNVAFNVAVCADTNFPALIPLTNALPFVASLTENTNYLAPPGPPRWFFFEFQITNSVQAVLFELYNLSGEAALVLQRDVPPVMAPYFAFSDRPGTDPEQIVVRSGPDFNDLRGNWYLGVYSYETTNQLSYTLRAAVSQGGLLPSALPLVITNQVVTPDRMLLSWYAVVGDWYVVSFTNSLLQTNIASVLASSPVATFLVPTPTNGGAYAITHTYIPPTVRPNLTIKNWPGNQLRISWPTISTGFTLQYSLTLSPPVWVNVGLPVLIEGSEFVVYDNVSSSIRFYRLTQ
jgi:hypothetical protein